MTLPLHVCAVVPAKNEEQRIGNALRQICRAGIRDAVIVMNGCRDQTYQAVNDTIKALDLQVLYVWESAPLGPDVARALGAMSALRHVPSCQGLVIVDGDLLGSFGPSLADFLAEAMQERLDVLWSTRGGRWRLDSELWDATLARTHPSLRLTAPSECPLFVRKEVLQTISPMLLAHPGRWFARCILAGLDRVRIGLSGAWNGTCLGNPVRTALHQQRMAETLVGDALEGCSLLLHRKATRWLRGKFYDGYDSQRRIDLVERHYASLTCRM